MSNYFIYELVIQLIQWVVAISSILGVVVYYYLNTTNRIYIIYMLLGSIIELVATSFSRVGRNNLVFIHLDTLLSFIVLTLFFANMFSIAKDRNLKLVLLTGASLIIINSICFQPITTYNSHTLTAVGAYIIGCCLYYFYRFIDQLQTNTQDIFTKYAVWSIFVLHIISIVVFILGNSLLEVENPAQAIIWFVRALIMLFIKAMILFHLVKILFDFLIRKHLNE
jgi:hypothetical protein